MILPLTLITEFGAPVEAPADSWRRYVSRRAELISRMEMATCNGCDDCGTRCIDGFLVTKEEYQTARAYWETLPPEETARIAAQPKTLPWPGAEETGATITLCRYRDNERGQCGIYPARPTICRLFGHTQWLPCPSGAVKKFPADAAEIWNEYRRFPRRTWSDWEEEFNPTPAREGIAREKGE